VDEYRETASILSADGSLAGAAHADAARRRRSRSRASIARVTAVAHTGATTTIGTSDGV